MGWGSLGMVWVHLGVPKDGVCAHGGSQGWGGGPWEWGGGIWGSLGMGWVHLGVSRDGYGVLGYGVSAYGSP